VHHGQAQAERFCVGGLGKTPRRRAQLAGIKKVLDMKRCLRTPPMEEHIPFLGSSTIRRNSDPGQQKRGAPALWLARARTSSSVGPLRFNGFLLVLAPGQQQKGFDQLA